MIDGMESESQVQEIDRLRVQVATMEELLQVNQEIAMDYARQLEARASELTRANDELERFNRLAVGRELRMIELKRQINELCQALGRPQTL